MSASAVFIMDAKGKIIISRNYRGDIPTTTAERFARFLNEEEDVRLKPVLYDDGVSFVYITHNNIILMAMTKHNANPLIMLSFLSSLVDVLSEYFKELNEESLRDNFVITYELLDEVMDFGFPQSTDANILKEFICVTERHTFRRSTPVTPSVPVAMTQRVSWRKEGIVHKKNEVFLDVVERLNILVGSNGNVLRSEVEGVLKMRTFLSGMPELKLGLNDKILMDARARAANGDDATSRTKSVEMEDIRFHQCVQLGRFENDRTISFIPPDGYFDLMTYRLNTHVRPLIWVEAHVEPHSSSRVEYLVKVKANYKRRSTANDVVIVIPVPSDADSPTFKASTGSVEYVPERDCLLWTIKTLQGQKEFVMRAQLGLPSVTANDLTKARPPIKVSFEIPYFTVSGIQVRYLKITEASRYQALPWVRYITKNGNYEVRF